MLRSPQALIPAKILRKPCEAPYKPHVRVSKSGRSLFRKEDHNIAGRTERGLLRVELTILWGGMGFGKVLSGPCHSNEPGPQTLRLKLQGALLSGETLKF